MKSPIYRLKVVELPYVQRLELELHFPAYTGLAPRKIEDGGDLAVLKGTEVRVKVTPTMASPGGQILVHDALKLPLTAAADNTLTGAFIADKDGFYRFELDAPSGERVSASPQYTIDVLTDQGPTVSIAKPGRDTSASPIEEVFVEARAEDDFGAPGWWLVNGRPKSVRLFDGKNRLAEVTWATFISRARRAAGRFRHIFPAPPTTPNGVSVSRRHLLPQVRPLRKGSGARNPTPGRAAVAAVPAESRVVAATAPVISRQRQPRCGHAGRQAARTRS